MRKILFSMLALILGVGTIMAQKELTQGYIKMEMTEVNSDNEQMAMQLQMLKGTQTEVHFKGDKYVTSMNMMGGMMVTQTFVNQKDKSFDMLMDMMGQKMWINSTMDEMNASENAQVAKNAKVTYDKKDTKKILGYNAYKVMIEFPDQKDMSVTGYITEEIKTKANLMQGMEALELDGYPLEFTVTNPMMSMSMSTIEIKEDVDASKLEMNTEGYKKMTMEEFSKQMGGMSGGMGF